MEKSPLKKSFLMFLFAQSSLFILLVLDNIGTVYGGGLEYFNVFKQNGARYL